MVVEIQTNQKTYREYLIFWIGQRLSLLGSATVQFVIIWWVTVETQSAMYLALAAILGFGTQILLTPIAGVYVDRWSRKKIIAITDTIQALATLLLIISFLIHVGNLWFVFLMLTIRGMCQAFHSPAIAAITPIMVPEDKLQRMNSWNYLANGLINIVGPVVAAFLLIFLKFEIVLFIDIITYIMAIIPLIGITIPSVVDSKPDYPGQEKTSFIKEFKEGLGVINGITGFTALIVISSLLNFLITPIDILLPYVINVVYNGTAENLALVMVCFNVGLILGALGMSFNKREIKRKLLFAWILIYICNIGYGILAFTPNNAFTYVILGTGLFLMGLVLPAINIMFMTIFQQVIPPEKQGRVFSVMTAVGSGITPLGMFLSGLLSDLIGANMLFLACALTSTVIITFAWFFTDVRFFGNLRTDDIPQVVAEEEATVVLG
ncbi:MAG: MFS transporter [Candidatus Hodarchaeales archaeon]|jgi:DHA3 family macrolide efflux protein-like MFS transporter